MLISQVIEFEHRSGCENHSVVPFIPQLLPNLHNVLLLFLFQFSDGQCICRTGYEYYDEGGLLVAAVDGSVDCQPIVYDRCYTGEALDVDGACISERFEIPPKSHFDERESKIW